MRLRRRPVVGIAVIALLALAAVGCTGDGIRIQIETSPEPSGASRSAEPSLDGALHARPVHAHAETSAAAMRALCVAPTPVSTGDGGEPGSTPPAIDEVERQVEAVRQLRYLEPVAADPMTPEQLAGDLASGFDDAYPETFYDRRTVAWQTIGVIPPDVTIRGALLAFQTGGVVGFYDPEDRRLEFIGDDPLDLTERYVLAHELTHAIDDQHFDLTRLDAVAAACRDEPFQASLGAIEGSAQYFATQVLLRFPDPAAGMGDVGGGIPDGVPPFIADLQLWPYDAGQAFITALEGRGGIGEVNEALTHLPRTTEQVMHPELFPSAAPPAPEVGDLSHRLGKGWGDLDAMVVGEQWLRAMLRLRLDVGAADDAAAGWNGGVYRAWTDGTDTAVLFRTAWDSDGDAASFAAAMRAWIDASGRSGFVDDVRSPTVMFGFASQAGALEAISAGP
jgi:hypothetical protein